MQPVLRREKKKLYQKYCLLSSKRCEMRLAPRRTKNGFAAWVSQVSGKLKEGKMGESEGHKVWRDSKSCKNIAVMGNHWTFLLYRMLNISEN